MNTKKIIGIKVQSIILICFAVLFSVNCNGQQIVEGNTMNNSDKYEVKIIVGDKVIEAKLEDNPTTQDFISLLPLDVELEDYAGT